MDILGIAKIVILIAILSAVYYAVDSAWDRFTGGYISIGEDRQLEKDKVEWNKEHTLRLAAEQASSINKSNFEGCDSKLGANTSELNQKKQEVLDLQKDNHQLALKNAAIKKAAQQEIDELNVAALAKPVKGQSCEVILKKTDDVLRKGARSRAGAKQ